MTTSIRMLQQLSAQKHLHMQAIPISRAELLVTLGHHVAEARLEVPEVIIQEYLDSVVKELKERSEEDAGRVYHGFAMFCDQQLRITNILNNNVGFRNSVPSRYRNKPDINDRDENSRQAISKYSSLLSIPDSQQTAHTHRKEDMANILKPMLDKDASSILICWGEKECCHIVPVIVADSADEVTAWGEISRHSMHSRGAGEDMYRHLV